MGCAFCASYERGADPEFDAGRDAWTRCSVAGKDSGLKISNIVLMGTGEPLDNYDNVVQFLRLVTHPGWGSTSACGTSPFPPAAWCPELTIWRQLNWQLTLSISLHAPNNAIRSTIMPVNRRVPGGDS